MSFCRRPDAEEDEVLQEFDAKVAAAGGSGAAEPEDDELQIEDRGDIAPNAACPITGVGVRSPFLGTLDVKQHDLVRGAPQLHAQCGQSRHRRRRGSGAKT